MEPQIEWRKSDNFYFLEIGAEVILAIARVCLNWLQRTVFHIEILVWNTVPFFSTAGLLLELFIHLSVPPPKYAFYHRDCDCENLFFTRFLMLTSTLGHSISSQANSHNALHSIVSVECSSILWKKPLSSVRSNPLNYPFHTYSWLS